MSVEDTGWPCLCSGECEVQLETSSDLLHAYEEKREDGRETDCKEEIINQSEGQR